MFVAALQRDEVWHARKGWKAENAAWYLFGAARGHSYPQPLSKAGKARQCCPARSNLLLRTRMDARG